MSTEKVKFAVIDRQSVYDIDKNAELSLCGISYSIMSDIEWEEDAEKYFSNFLFLLGVKNRRIILARSTQTGKYGISITIDDAFSDKWIFDKAELLNVKNLSEEEQRNLLKKAETDAKKEQNE